MMAIGLWEKEVPFWVFSSHGRQTAWPVFYMKGCKSCVLTKFNRLPLPVTKGIYDGIYFDVPPLD